MWAFLITLRPSSVRPSVHNYKKIFSSETAQPILTKLWWNVLWVVLYQNCVRWPRPQTKMAARLKIEKREDEILKIFSSETTKPIQAKLYWNDPWVFPFQNCVGWKKGGWISKIFSSETIVQILTKLCWNGVWVVFFQNYSGISDAWPRWPPQPTLV